MVKSGKPRERPRPLTSQTHKTLRALHQPVKKARDFEIRKVVRKLKDAKETSSDGASLEALLRALKASSVAALAAQQTLRLLSETLPEADRAALQLQAAGAEDAGEAAEGRSPLLAPDAAERVLKAKCVQEAAQQLAQVQEEEAARLRRKEKRDRRAHAAGEVERQDSPARPADEEVDSEAQAALAKLSRGAEGGSGSESEGVDLDVVESDDDLGTAPERPRQAEKKAANVERVGRGVGGVGRGVGGVGRGDGRNEHSRSREDWRRESEDGWRDSWAREQPMRRTNRMSQRERRRQALLKYGDKCLNPPKEEHLWRGGVGQRGKGGRREREQARPGPKAPAPTRISFDDGGRPVAPNRPKVAKDASVHPSWAAKKEQQEAMRQSLQGGAAASKKIVFDD